MGELDDIERDLERLQDEGWTDFKVLLQILRRLDREHVLADKRQEKLMATLQDVIDAEAATNDSVQAAAARVATDLAALKDQVTALQAQIDAGSNVTAADLDSLKAGLDAIGTDATAIDPAAVVEPPPVDVPPVVDPNA